MKFAFRLLDKQINCIYVTQVAVAEQCVRRLLERSHHVLGFDIETGRKAGFLNDGAAGLCPYRSFISLIQLYDGIDTIYMFDMLSIPLPMLAPVFKAKRLVAHNAIFDAQHLMHNGITDFKIDCSMIMYNMARCAEYTSAEEEEAEIEEGDGTKLDFLAKYERHGASLRAVTAKLLGIYVDKDLQTSNWTDRPISKTQLAYAAKDAFLTFEIARILSKQIVDAGMSRVYSLNRQAIFPVCQMILNGINFNVEQHEVDCAQWAKEQDALHIQILKLFGSSMNIRSTTQLSKWLDKNLSAKDQHSWPRSEKTNLLKSDAKTLNLYSHLPFVKPLLEYKRLEKMLGTYGLPLIAKINPVTKRLHGSYTLGYTATGRLSSRSPNIQQLPRDSHIRGVFTKGKDTVLVGADYGQIEMRVAALLSRDKTMLNAFDKSIDLHKYIAHVVTGKPLAKVTKEDRQLGKSLNFGLLFGLGAPGLVEYSKWNYGVDLSLDQARDYVKKFFNTYSGYAAWQKKQRDACEISEEVRTKLGKVRKLPPGKMYTRSVNHPVQGTAAEVMLLALNKLYTSVDNNSISMIACVHDEILLEVDTDSVEEATDILQANMEDAMKQVFPTATLQDLVEVKVGNTWAELK